MHSKKQSKRFAIIATFSTALVLLATVIVAWLIIGGRHAPLFADFTGYESQLPLNGSIIKNTHLVRIKERGFDIWRFDYKQEYDSGVILYQRKVGDYAGVPKCNVIGLSVRREYSYECSESTFKNKGRYVVELITYKDKLSMILVEAVLDETEFYVYIPKDQLEKYSEYKDWHQYFEAMEPVNLMLKPYEIRETQPWGG